MWWKLLNKHWFIKRFVLVYIAALIMVGSFSDVVLALTFDPVQNLSGNLTGSANPQIVASASNIYVAWHGVAGDRGIADIFFRRSTDAGLTWIPSLDQVPLNISADTTTHSIDPMIGASGSNIFILWQTNTSGSAPSGGLLFRRSTDGGNSFVEPIQDLGASPYSANIPRQMVVLGSTIYVVWQEFPPYPATYPILFRRSTDAGSTWDPPLGQPARVLSPSSNAGPAVAASGHYVYVTWESVDHNLEPGLFFSRSTDGGVTFEPAQQIAQTPNYSRIIANGTNVYIISNTGQSACTGEVIFRRSTDNGATWDPPLQNLPLNLLVAPGQATAPQLYTDGSTIYTVWLGRLDGATCADPNINPLDILFRRSTDGGVTWDPPLDHPALGLSAHSGAYSPPPEMAVSGTNLSITWIDNVRTILFRHSPNGGTTWDPPLTQSALNLSLNLAPVLQPQIAAAGVNTYVVWTDESPGTPSIFFRRAVESVIPIKSQFLDAFANLQQDFQPFTPPIPKTSEQIAAELNIAGTALSTAHLIPAPVKAIVMKISFKYLFRFAFDIGCFIARIEGTAACLSVPDQIRFNSLEKDLLYCEQEGCIVDGNIKLFTASSFQLFNFNLAIPLENFRSSSLKQGDQFVTAVPFLGLEPSFSIATMKNIIAKNGFMIVEVNVEGVSIAPEPFSAFSVQADIEHNEFNIEGNGSFHKTAKVVNSLRVPTAGITR